MGTRAIITVYDENDRPLVKVYNHWDGYPAGLGVDIAKALGGKTFTATGITDRSRQINGMGDAAAMLIAAIKNPNEAGSVYITNDDGHAGGFFGIEYFYDLRRDGDHVRMTISDPDGNILFDQVMDDADQIIDQLKNKY